MARQIGKMLNAREPKIINGPEILNKFVGQSEENVRKLFEDAEEEQKRVRERTFLVLYNVFLVRSLIERNYTQQLQRTHNAQKKLQQADNAFR